MRTVILCSMVAMLVLAACGKYDDPNIKDQYYVYLEDDETGQAVSDQVLFTQYRNGTATCGFALLNADDGCGNAVDDKTQQCHEDACYKMVETVFYAQLDALKTQLEAEKQLAAQEEAGETPLPTDAPSAAGTVLAGSGEEGNATS